MTTKLLLSLLAFVASGLGQSQTRPDLTITDGNSLASFCKETPKPTAIDGFSMGMCIGYISGIVGAEQVSQLALKMENIPDTRTLKFCTDQQATIERFVAIVQLYLIANPKRRHLPAALIVQTAFTAAYPCGTNKPSSKEGEK